MSTDRELLELAAKAAGMELQWHERGIDSDDIPDMWDEEYCYVPTAKPPNDRRASDKGQGIIWSPLTDDGDALRLAVKLKLNITFVGDSVCADWHSRDASPSGWAYGASDEAATRRAIVRAAAELGRGIAVKQEQP
jgi:hypothetical protein